MTTRIRFHKSAGYAARNCGIGRGRPMDPDLDPNPEHWQDRLDNFQWVVGSLVGLLDSVPT